MQTFIPYPRFRDCARVLDTKRLGKQRVEGRQILDALFVGTDWSTHVAVRMWCGYEAALCEYLYAICDRWIDLGFRDTQLPIIERYHSHCADTGAPPWWGDPEIHASHRAVLLGKNFAHYRQFGWDERPAKMVNKRWPYKWPVPLLT